MSGAQHQRRLTRSVPDALDCRLEFVSLGHFVLPLSRAAQRDLVGAIIHAVSAPCARIDTARSIVTCEPITATRAAYAHANQVNGAAGTGTHAVGSLEPS